MTYPKGPWDHESSVDLSEPFILWPQVQIPKTPSILFMIYFIHPTICLFLEFAIWPKLNELIKIISVWIVREAREEHLDKSLCVTPPTPTSVWPYLANFRHFGKTLKVFGYSLRVYFVLGTILNKTGPIFIMLDHFS